MEKKYEKDINALISMLVKNFQTRNNIKNLKDISKEELEKLLSALLNNFKEFSKVGKNFENVTEEEFLSLSRKIINDLIIIENQNINEDKKKDDVLDIYNIEDRSTSILRERC